MIGFDGRALTRRHITGVERYAHEIYGALASLTPIHVISPTRQLGRMLDHAWVHTALPRHARHFGLTSLLCPVMDAPISLHRSIRLGVTIHDIAFTRHPEMYKPAFRWYYRVVLPLITRRADVIVCISEGERAHIEELYPHARGKTRVVYSGISASFRCQSFKKKEPIILAVGALNRHKNLYRLLIAYESIMDQVPHRLVLIGANRSVISSDNEAEAAIKRLETTGNVLRLGHVSDRELIDWYSKSDIFAFPSLFEGFGFPPLEAMAAGCVVCCSNAPAMPEICGNAAVYFDPYRVDDIAATIRSLARNDSLKATLRAEGLKRSAQFTWERAARTMYEILC